MSRLGREYLQVGQLTELYLPTKGVRFIAINDGVDSLVESSTDFNPIRNWANELHAKDASKKVRAVKKMQAERGECLGGRPPYGCRRKAPDSKEIIPPMRKPLQPSSASSKCAPAAKARTKSPAF